MPPTTATDSPTLTDAPDSELARLGSHLQQAWRELLGERGADVHKPADLARAWRVDPTLAARIFRALRDQDPLTVLHELPAVPSLQGLLAAARRRGVDKEKIRQAEIAVGELEELIRRVGGSKSNLDTIVGSQVQHSRRKTEQTSKQAIFRGFSSLLGVQANTSIASYYVYPSDDPNWCNELAVYGYDSLLRLRPELPILFGVRHTITEDKDEVSDSLRTLHGDQIVPTAGATAIKQFCSDPFPKIEIREENKRLLYVWSDQADEPLRPVDLIFASLELRAEARYRTEQRQFANYNLVPRNPSKNLLLDVFVHRDVWPGVEPELVMLRRGNPQSPRLITHSLDRVDFLETLDHRGSQAASIPCKHYPSYAKLTSYVHHEMKWQIGDFRLYRCSVRYPVVGLWYSIQFPLPPQNSAGR